jgi:hypothetical protein
MTLNRILDEGYGPGAWYGSDMKAAVAGVAAGDAFKRPAKGRHNIAEVALHHAYWAGQIESKLTGKPAAAFPLPGEDWFELNTDKVLSWSAITDTLDSAQSRLAKTVKSLAGGKGHSPLSEKEQQDLVLGITGHAAYHAGQLQLIKKLIGA